MKAFAKTPEVVTVADGAYVMDPTMLQAVAELGNPIFDPRTGQLFGITNPRRAVHIHSYGGEAPFFNGIARAGRLYGTRCDNSKCSGHGTIYLPFRIYCPDCLHKATVVDLTERMAETATVYTFVVTERTGAFNTLETPIRFIDVEMDGVATIVKSYLLGGVDPNFGMRVVPIFRTKAPTWTILDLAFVPAGTTEDQLPPDFTFASPLSPT